ncbi:MAG: ribosome biogenesis GTPase YlqF [Vigna little leaf phytoplasma]|nr:ribosome biogenesis GTPase YlqF [Vigna little leaf phytoplasma]
MHSIQWFPGHMKKTLQEIKNNLRLVNFVLIILDSRIPFSSINWELLKILNNKPFLFLLNKSTLADHIQNQPFLAFFQKKKFPYLNIDAKYNHKINLILPYIKKILRYQYKINYKVLKLMIVGVPNVGKSTLINKLKRKKTMMIANSPGVTKKLQWIKLSTDVKLVDTPGILYPKIVNSFVSYSLALCSCIKESLLPLTELLEYLLIYFRDYYPKYLKILFNLTQEEIQHKNLFFIIRQKTNILNEEQMFFSILNQIKKGKIKNINFDLNLKFLLTQ